MALKYPGDLAESTTDWVSFKFKTYQAPYSGASSTASNQVSSAYEKYNVSLFANAAGYDDICMYMPEDISVSYAGTWGGREFGPLAPMALAGAGGVLNAGEIGGITAAGQKMAAEIGDMRMGALPYIGASSVASIMNRLPGFGGGVTGNDILATTRGQILNPNTEVLYQGPQLRTFSLSYKMFARSKAEADIISKICKNFKKAVLPASSKDGEKNLIGVPKVVEVKFYHKNTEHPFVHKYKPCALGGVDVNLTPDGSWATYKEGQPIATQLTLQFQELKLLYEDDINAGY